MIARKTCDTLCNRNRERLPRSLEQELMPEPAETAPLAIDARSVPPRAKQSSYPEPFFSRMSKREKRQLGDQFGLKNFGVNLTRLFPGGESALLHRHSKQD
jgi:hypothetical protein